MGKFARMRTRNGSIPSFSVSVGTDAARPYQDNSLSDAAEERYKSLLSAGFPVRFKYLYSGIARYLGEEVHLLDFHTTHEFDVFSQVPEKHIQEGTGSVLLEDVYSFLRWDGSFVGTGENGFGSRRCSVLQRVLSCTAPIAEHVGDFVVLTRGETVKEAFDSAIYSRGLSIFGILFEQRSGDRLLNVILYVSKHKNTLSPYNRR